MSIYSSIHIYTTPSSLTTHLIDMSRNLSHGGLRFCQVTNSLKMKENSLHLTLHIYTSFKSKIFIYVNILIKSYVLMDKCIDFLVIYIYKWCKNDLHKRNLLFLNLYKNN